MRTGLCSLIVLISATSARGQDLDFRLVVVTTPTAVERQDVLPASVPAIPLGRIYYVEMWVSDVGAVNTGVSSAYVDLLWPNVATAVAIDHGSLFDRLPSGIIAPGIVDELGGSVLSATGVGIEPEWARVAFVELLAVSAGEAAHALNPSTTGAAALGRGVIPWNDILLGEAALHIRAIGDLNCDGAFNGGDIDPFFQALGDPGLYAQQYPECDWMLADMNCDGAVNGADIDEFFICLGGGGCSCP